MLEKGLQCAMQLFEVACTFLSNLSLFFFFYNTITIRTSISNAYQVLLAVVNFFYSFMCNENLL